MLGSTVEVFWCKISFNGNINGLHGVFSLLLPSLFLGSVHSSESLGNREIKLSPKVAGKGKAQTTKTDAKGGYCFEAAPGTLTESRAFAC